MDAKNNSGIDTTSEVRLLQQKLALHIELTPLAYIEWDLNFCVVEWNPAAARIFGYSKEEAMGRHAADLLIPKEARPVVDDVWRALLDQRGGTRSSNDNVTKDGHILHCEWYNTPLVDANNAVIGVASLIQDVTGQRQAEEDRLRLQDEIINAQQAALSELSTPLIPITDEIVVMPLIGMIDSRRAQDIMDTLLQGIADTGANVAILDITGVAVVDTQVASALLRAAQATQLLGATVLLTGIRPEIAQTLVGLGSDLSNIITRSTLQSGIAYAMKRHQAVRSSTAPGIE